MTTNAPTPPSYWPDPASAAVTAAIVARAYRAALGVTAPPPPVACSFCGKTQHEVVRIIAGPNVWICDECIWLCVDIIGEEEGRVTRRGLDYCADGFHDIGRYARMFATVAP